MSGGAALAWDGDVSNPGHVAQLRDGLLLVTDTGGDLQEGTIRSGQFVC